jgi:hypothetical protein
MASITQAQLRRCSALLGLLGLTGLLAGCSTNNSARMAAAPAQVCFVGLTNLGAFARSENGEGTVVLTSPEVATAFPWKELVVSWNVELREGAGLKVEARAHYPGRNTGYYTMGWWAEELSRHRCESVTGQRDEDGDVKTDTLVLERGARWAQVRLTLLAGESGQWPKVKFVGLSFAGAEQGIGRTQAIAAARGRVLDVPEKSQLSYEGGRDWCSPTCVSMVLTYWGEKLGRAELKLDVPVVAAAVYDRNWPGTGNWPFNTAFAGRFPGIRAYVARLADVAQLEAWVAAGVPPVASVAPDLMNAQPVETSGGHLVVCVGFTAGGDVIINDPGADPRSSAKLRRTIPRERFAAAWERSRRTAYLIYPETKGVVPFP